MKERLLRYPRLYNAMYAAAMVWAGYAGLQTAASGAKYWDAAPGLVIALLPLTALWTYKRLRTGYWIG